MTQNVSPTRIFSTIDEVIEDMIIDAFIKCSDIDQNEATQKAKDAIDLFCKKNKKSDCLFRSEIDRLLNYSILAHSYTYQEKEKTITTWTRSSLVKFIDEDPQFLPFFKKENLLGVTRLYQDGGGEGGSEDCEFIFDYKGIHYRFNYTYYSHHGYEFPYNSLTHVLPRKVEIIQWFPAGASDGERE